MVAEKQIDEFVSRMKQAAGQNLAEHRFSTARPRPENTRLISPT